MFLCSKITTITQLNFLFLLYFWSLQCRYLIKLLIKWIQFISNYQKYTLRKPMKKQVALPVFYVLPRHNNIMTDKGFIIFDDCGSRSVYLFPHEEKCTTSSWGDSKMYTSGSIASSQRILTEINKSDAIAKIRIWAERRIAEGRNFLCCLIIVAIFIGLGGAHIFGEDFKVVMWWRWGGGGQATKVWDQFLWGDLTPWDTKYRFSCGNWRRSSLDEIVKKCGRKRFYISCNWYCTLSFLVKILLFKLKNLYIQYAWIWFMKKQNNNQNVNVEKMWYLSKLLTITITTLILIIFSAVL